MQIDAIVFDLDDTLLNGEARVSAYTRDVMRRAKEQGVHIVPASGRAIFSMQPFVEQLAPDNPYIACNGAQLVNPDHTPMETHAFPIEEAKALIHFFNENGFYVQCYHGDHIYYSEACDASRSYMRSSGMYGVALGDLEARLDFETPKVLSVQSPERVREMLPIVRERFPNATVTVSKPYFLEAQPAGVSKGFALKRLAERMGWSLEHIMAFGDSLNDLSMLEAVGYGVAVGNARDEVKRAVRFVCGANTEDGVARFVEAHVLKGGREP